MPNMTPEQIEQLATLVSDKLIAAERKTKISTREAMEMLGFKDIRSFNKHMDKLHIYPTNRGNKFFWPIDKLKAA